MSTRTFLFFGDAGTWLRNGLNDVNKAVFSFIRTVSSK